jgi:hypothetical protein
MENCILTGLPLSESPIKKMCYNCVSFTTEGDSCICKNVNVIKVGTSKIEEAAKQLGFDIESLKLKPMVLKKPHSKCPNYEPNMAVITQYIASVFTANSGENE